MRSCALICLPAWISKSSCKGVAIVTKGLLGKKIGMTQIFASDGKVVPVTVVEASPNTITQVKSVESDG